MVINEKEFLGKISLLNIWSSWCISCRYEHDILLDIAKDNKISVYGLNYRDNRDDALSMLNNYGNPYKKIIFDPKGDLAINLGVYGTPETYLIDRDGIIRYSIIGPLSWDVWRSKVVKILAMLGE
jgi:cytochrome c biogenesis protein CcmG/thiol:disulfide interchange protein DsbE